MSSLKADTEFYLPQPPVSVDAIKATGEGYMPKLTGRAALVTGAAMGFGRAFDNMLARVAGLPATDPSSALGSAARG